MAGAPLDLPPLERAAALLLALGQETARPILQRLDDEELKLVARASAGLGPVPSGTLAVLARDFETRLSAGSDVHGDPGMMETLLAGALPSEKLTSILADLRGSADEGAFLAAGRLAPERLAMLLAGELPQTAAQILLRLGPAVAARALEVMEDGPRNAVLCRMVNLKAPSGAALAALANGLSATLSHPGAEEGGSKGPSLVAGIINNLDRRQADLALQQIEAAEPEAAGALKSLLFSFEDIATLPAKARAAVMEGVSSDKLVFALSGTEASFRDAILSSLATRARRIVESELASAGEVSARDISLARRAIARQALALAEQGRITLQPEAAANG